MHFMMFDDDAIKIKQIKEVNASNLMNIHQDFQTKLLKYQDEIVGSSFIRLPTKNGFC